MLFLRRILLPRRDNREMVPSKKTIHRAFIIATSLLAMRITIPRIPPFVTDGDAWADSNDDGDEDDDFIALFESALEEEIDFSLQLENELENDLFSTATLLSNSATSSFMVHSPQLFFDDGDDEEIDATTDRPPKRARGKCFEDYKLGDLFQSCWYTKFLLPDRDGVEGSRTRTRRQSGRDRQGVFRSTFRLSLEKVERLADLMIEKEIVVPTRRLKTRFSVQTKAELHVLGALCVLAHGLPFQVISTYSNISKEEHRLFFHKFINYFFDNHRDYIYLPRDGDELRSVSRKYHEVGLPGCMGSKDVVHVKWSRAPAGDFNRCKGKESYPTIAFQCVSNFERRILGVSRAQYGTRNDKSIVRRDHNVHAVCTSWYSTVEWEYFTIDGEIGTDVGCYLICDNGYLRWPTSICPYMHADKTSMEGYFSTNLESVRKDVECIFGIIKKRWRVLDHGFKFRSMEICEKIFFTCCCLHNEMLDMMESRTTRYRVSRGLANATDGMWLADGCDDLQELMETSDDDSGMMNKRTLARKWAERRRHLAEHLYYSRRDSLN